MTWLTCFLPSFHRQLSLLRNLCSPTTRGAFATDLAALAPPGKFSSDADEREACLESPEVDRTLQGLGFPPFREIQARERQEAYPWSLRVNDSTNVNITCISKARCFCSPRVAKALGKWARGSHQIVF